MASPLPAEDVEMHYNDGQPPVPATVHQENDDEGSAAGSEEGEGDDIGPGGEEDSSEEEEDDIEEMRKIQKDFIVDEDDDEGEDQEDVSGERRRRKKKKKKRRHRRDEEEDLDDEDLELMQENMGISSSRHKLTRLRRGRAGSESESPEPTSHQRVGRGSDDGDDVNALQRMFDDERDERGGDEMEVDDYDDFIDDEGEEGEMDEEERKERRRAERERRRTFGAKPEMAGIDPAAWEEIFEVFGDGRDYEWALEGEEGEELDDVVKPEMKYTDVFEPSEIKARHLTEEDDIIRMTDIPERMQLSGSTLSSTATLTLHDELDLSGSMSDAAAWVAMRISPRITRDFFRPAAIHSHLLTALILAISAALDLILVKNYEVPYIHTHCRDLVSHFDVERRVLTQLLSRDELWRVGSLGMKFRALMERKEALLKTYKKMDVEDAYFDQEIKDKLDTIEMVADAVEWLGMMHRQAQKDALEIPEEDGESKKYKKPSRVTAYDRAKQTVTAKLAEDFGISSQDIVRNMIANKKSHPTFDEPIVPLSYAEQFISGTGVGQTPEEQLEMARTIIATELGKDPLMRKEIRTVFTKDGVISVLPTERGLEKIDDYHPYYNFKYLKDKPITNMTDSSQFLQILQAEKEHLVTVQIKLPGDVQQAFEAQLYESFASESTSAVAKLWNEQRQLVIREAMDKYLLPTGAKWGREWLREEVEDALAKKAGDSLQDRINQAPYRTEDIEPGDVPSVMAVSWGKGDPQKDAIHVVVLDEEGRLRDHLKLDNLYDEDMKDQFNELLKRRNPDAVVVAGLTVHTKKLIAQLKLIINGEPIPTEGDKPAGDPSAAKPADGWGSQGGGASGWGSSSGADGWGNSAVGNSSGGWGDTSASQDKTSSPERPKKKDDKERHIPVFYVNDEVARIYQHSKRAEDEYGRIPLTGRYCVGLARYIQSPVNEYAALGPDLTAITFDDAQTLVPKEKLLIAFERSLVNVVNTVGVDVNRAVVDPYYQALLPFIAGLGPRKAQQLVQRISAMGGTLINRSQLIHENILPMTVFLNASGFLRISRETSYRRSSNKKRNRNKDPADALPDPLDDTRIHPEDYDLAKQMALDALEIDQDDVDDDAHAAQLISKLMDDPDNAKKLDVLNLDDFAAILQKDQGKNKRHTLNMIKAELLKPFGEQRKEFQPMDKWDIITMLTGETEETLRRGKIVSISVLRVKSGFVAVRMDSGIEGILSANYLSDDGATPADKVVQKGQTVPAVIIAVYTDDIRVEFSARPMDIKLGDASLRRVPTDEYYDQQLNLRNKDLADRKKRREVDQVRRVIKHPNFHNLNFKQAEELLSQQQRGDVIIRPSTKGPNHLAVTWKVDDGVYQHIDVVDPNADPTSQNVGSHLIVDGKYHFTDLDELIVNHVKAMARKVEEMIAHEKFQKGSESEIHVFLDNTLKAKRGVHQRSVYAFGLNRKKPGYFDLHFKSNMNSPIQTMLVKVIPGGYQLDANSEGGSVAELCDCFKKRIMNMQAPGGQGAQTPYISGRTPAITPGRATPGHLSSRHTPGHASSRLNPAAGKTPNPYGGPAAKTPNPYGGAVPPGRSVSSSTPAHSGGWGGPPAPPSGQSGGWGSSNGGGGGGGGWGNPTPSGGNGWSTPAQPQQPSAPPGMHPSRAALIQGSNPPARTGW